jgi:hypothetical protein
MLTVEERALAIDMADRRKRSVGAPALSGGAAGVDWLPVPG